MIYTASCECCGSVIQAEDVSALIMLMDNLGPDMHCAICKKGICTDCAKWRVRTEVSEEPICNSCVDPTWTTIPRADEFANR